jgi:hypothetical protein
LFLFFVSFHFLCFFSLSLCCQGRLVLNFCHILLQICLCFSHLEIDILALISSVWSLGLWEIGGHHLRFSAWGFWFSWGGYSVLSWFLAGSWVRFSCFMREREWMTIWCFSYQVVMRTYDVWNQTRFKVRRASHLRVRRGAVKRPEPTLLNLKLRRINNVVRDGSLQ